MADIDFENRHMHFRVNRWRGLKKKRHTRWVPLWPALEACLRQHCARHHLTNSDALFSWPNGQPYKQISKTLVHCMDRAQLAGRGITLHALRHTYTTQLMQTWLHDERGIRVQRSSLDIAKHLGHATALLVDRTYTHLVKFPRYRDEMTYEIGRQFPFEPNAPTSKKNVARANKTQVRCRAAIASTKIHA